jgi:hypothetical protein
MEMIELVSSGASTEQKLSKSRAAWDEQRKAAETKAKELTIANTELAEKVVCS